MRALINGYIRPTWQKQVQQRQQAFDPRYILYHTLRADDPALADRLRDWQDRRDAAHKTFTSFIDKLAQTSQPGPLSAKLFYKTDEDGRLAEVSCYGSLPRGWRMTTGTEDNWIEPETIEARRALAAVPPAPPLRERAALIGWPYRDEKFTPGPARPLARQFNSLPRIRTEGDAVLVELPDPGNFDAHPLFQRAAQNWHKPEGLTYLGMADTVWTMLVRYGARDKAPAP